MRSGLKLLSSSMFVLAGFALVGCGGSEDENPLEKFAGLYSTVESFTEESGSCMGTPVSAYEGETEVLIDKNSFEGRFEKWGTCKGEIDEGGSVLASNNIDADENVRFTGGFVEGAFNGVIRHLKAGCTRNYSISGIMETETD